MNKRFFALILLTFGVLFSGCKFASDLNDSTAIVIKLPRGPKGRAADGVKYFYDVYCYAGEVAEGLAYDTKQAYSDETIVFENVEPGTYTVNVKAYDAQNTDIQLYEGQYTGEVIEGTKSKFPISMKKLPKNYSWIEFYYDEVNSSPYLEAKSQCREGIEVVSYNWIIGDLYLSKFDNQQKLYLNDALSYFGTYEEPLSITLVTYYLDNTYDSFTFNQYVEEYVMKKASENRLYNEELKSISVNEDPEFTKKYTALSDSSANNLNYKITIIPTNNQKFTDAEMNVYSILELQGNAINKTPYKAACSITEDNKYVFNFNEKLDKGYYLIKVRIPCGDYNLSFSDMVRIDNGYLTSAQYTDYVDVYVEEPEIITDPESDPQYKNDPNQNGNNENIVPTTNTDKNLMNVKITNLPDNPDMTFFFYPVPRGQLNLTQMKSTYSEYKFDFVFDKTDNLYKLTYQDDRDKLLEKMFTCYGQFLEETTLYAVNTTNGIEDYFGSVSVSRNDLKNDGYIYSITLEKIPTSIEATFSIDKSSGINVTGSTVKYIWTISSMFTNPASFIENYKDSFKNIGVVSGPTITIDNLSIHDMSDNVCSGTLVFVFYNNENIPFAYADIIVSKDSLLEDYSNTITPQTLEQTFNFQASWNFSASFDNTITQLPDNWSFEYSLVNQNTETTLYSLEKTNFNSINTSRFFNISEKNLEMNIPVTSSQAGNYILTLKVYDENDFAYTYQSETIELGKNDVSYDNLTPTTAWHGYIISGWNIIYDETIEPASFVETDWNNPPTKMSFNEARTKTVPNPTAPSSKYIFDHWATNPTSKTLNNYEIVSDENQLYHLGSAYSYNNMNIKLYAVFKEDPNYVPGGNVSGSNKVVSNYSELYTAITSITGTNTETIEIAQDITVADTIIIKGNVRIRNKEGVNASINRGNTSTTIFKVQEDTSLIIESYDDDSTLTIDGKGLKGTIPVISNSGTLTINSNVIIQNCKSTGNGGAIVSEGYSGKNSILNLNGCSFDENETYKKGGALYLEYCTAEINQVDFNNNISYIETPLDMSSGGGAIYSKDSELSISKCNFTENQAYTYGAGILINNSDKPVSINECTFKDNYFLTNTGCYGAGIALTQCTQGFNISSSTFSGNTMGTSGPITSIYVEEVVLMDNNGQKLNNYINGQTVTTNKINICVDILNTDTFVLNGETSENIQ